MTEKNSEKASSEHLPLWDFCITLGLQSANDLRQALGLNEATFRRFAPTMHAEPGRCFAYRILDEVQKAAMSLMHWKEFLSEGVDLGDVANDREQQTNRLAIETIVDDQSLRARKLSEVLVDSILFSTTNDSTHYRDYFFLHDLNHEAHCLEDMGEFFGFENRNLRWSADFTFKQIQQLESEGLDPKTRWYLRQPGHVKVGWIEKGVPFATFRQKYKAVLKLALPSELVILGKSYAHAYGMSKDVHFSPHDISSDFAAEEVFLGADKVGLMLLALVIRCQLLLNCVPGGLNRSWREMHDSNSFFAQVAGDLKSRPAEIGDIVWVRGDFAEVLEFSTSNYGYSAYRVKYLETPPLSEVPEDWFAGFEIRLVAKREMVEQAAEQAAREMRESGSAAPDDSEKAMAYAKRAVVRLYHVRRRVRRSAGTGPDRHHS